MPMETRVEAAFSMDPSNGKLDWDSMSYAEMLNTIGYIGAPIAWHPYGPIEGNYLPADYDL